VTRALAAVLVAGSLLLLICTALHPVLPLTGPEDLALIAAMPHWRLIHLGLLYGTGSIIAGVWARWLIAADAERAGLGVAFVVLGLGHALNGVNIAYMTAAGTELAGRFQQGQDVAVLYQATHGAAVAAGRLGGFLVAMAAALIAATTSSTAAEPRWRVGLAWLAAGAGLAGNLLAPPGHPLMLTSVGVLAVWQVAVAVPLVWRR
jgi:hypothetical protein